MVGEQTQVTRWPRARAQASGPLDWWRYVLSGLAHGLFMLLAFPPAGVWPLAVVAIAPLVYAGCKGAMAPKRAAFWTTVGVLPLWLINHLWMLDVTEPGYPLLALYMSSYAFLFVWAIALARRVDWPVPMSIVVPVVWMTLEVLRCEIVLTGYAFYVLGHPLIDNAVLAAPAAVFGAYGVSFLCASLAGALADATGWSGLPRQSGGIGALATVLVWGVLSFVGRWSAHPAGPTKVLRVAVVQTNIAQDNKLAWTVGQRLKDFKRFAELTKQAAAQRPEPDLIVWPETMFPGYALNEQAVKAERSAGLIFRINDPDFPKDSSISATVFADDLAKLQGEVGIPMLVGAIAADGLKLATRSDGSISRDSDRRYNSAMVLRDGAVFSERYDKVELVPFGEVIPYLWRWPEAQQRVLSLGAAGMTFDLSWGDKALPLAIQVGRSSTGVGAAPASTGLATIRLATPICFEVTRTALCRRLVVGEGGEHACAIVNLSNDGWFGSSDSGRRTHLLAARWRCVEMGVPMVRSVNTGVSAAIDWRGRVITERVTALGGGAPATGSATGTGAVPKPDDGLRSSTRTDGVLVANLNIEPQGKLTVYARLGMAPVYSVSAGGVVGIAAVWRRRRQLARMGE